MGKVIQLPIKKIKKNHTWFLVNCFYGTEYETEMYNDLANKGLYCKDEGVYITDEAHLEVVGSWMNCLLNERERFTDEEYDSIFVENNEILKYWLHKTRSTS